MKKAIAWLCMLCMLLSGISVLASKTADQTFSTATMEGEIIIPFSEAEATGDWKTSTAIPGYDGKAHYWGTKEVTFKVSGIVKGKYEVFDWVMPHAKNAEQLTFEIYHNGNKNNASVYQKADEGETVAPGWVSLGVYEFSGDGSEYVKMLTTSICARLSGIKFVPTEKAVTETTSVEEDKQPSETVAVPDFGNIFEPYLTGKAPEVLEESVTTTNGVVSKDIVYSSYDGKNKIFAKMYYPEKEGKYPGVVFYHGGNGNAFTFDTLAQTLAKDGYVVISPELPGIGNPEKMRSEGDFKARGYNQEAQIGMYTDPRNSTIFEGLLSAIDAFYLLRSQDNVNVEKIGIAGNSWGGFTTTKIASLLGDDVACAYSWFGCAYYDAGTHWSQNVFPKFGEVNEKLWMTYLDASVTIDNLTAPYFIEAPTNDSYFYPDAVSKTLANIKGEKNKVFTPNINHAFYNGYMTQAIGFFNYYLKDSGLSLVSASEISATENENGSVEVTFTVPADRKTTAEVYVADATPHWNEKKWTKIEATVGNGKATAVISSKALFEDTIFYGFVTDENGFYASTDMVTLNNLKPADAEQEDEGVELAPAIVVNETDPECVQTGEWTRSSLTGFEGKSIYTIDTSANATYTPNIPEAGVYKVSAYLVANNINIAQVKAAVNTAKGSEEVFLSTSKTDSKWVTIGKFEFAQGTSGNVVLSADGKAGTLRLDAVKFEKVLAENTQENPDEIKVILNGKKLIFPDDQKPVLVNDRTMVAFRAIFEALGLSVGWDDATNTAMGEKEGMTIALPIGNTTALVNGIEKTTDVPAQLINERTFVPLRFLSEAMGFEVLWDGDTNTVTIKE